MSHQSLSSHNTQGLADQVDRIVVECRQDEYRQQTLLQNSALNSMRMDEDLPKVRSKADPFSKVKNTFAKFKDVDYKQACRNVNFRDVRCLIIGGIIAAILIIAITASVAVSKSNRSKDSIGVVEDDKFGEAKYRNCIINNATVDGVDWWLPVTGHSEGTLPAFDRPEVDCLSYCTYQLAGKCEWFSYEGTKEQTCRFVRNDIDVPKQLLRYVDLTAGIRLYHAECMASINDAVRPNFINPRAAAYEVVPPSEWGANNYQEILGQSMLFYEGMWAGPQPEGYRVDWRKPGYVSVCGTKGGGSFHDGTHIQSMMSTAHTLSMQLTSFLWYGQSYENTAYDDRLNSEWMIREIDHAVDWIISAWNPSRKHLLIAVGAELVGTANEPAALSYYGQADNAPPPGCTYATPQRPASDFVAAASAAMALASIHYERQGNIAMRQKTLQVAEQLMEFAIAHEATAISSGHYIGTMYPANDPTNPSQHRFYAACSLYQATDKSSWWAQAMEERVRVEDRLKVPISNWENPMWMGQLCMAMSAPRVTTRQNSARFLWNNFVEEWIFVDKDPITETQNALNYQPLHYAAKNGELDLEPEEFPTKADQENEQVGLFRDSANAAFIALMFADLPEITAKRGEMARCFAKFQLDYILGSNPFQMSYVVGYESDIAQTSPMTYQSRDSLCQPNFNCTSDTWEDDGLNNPLSQVLVGALVSSMELPSETWVHSRGTKNSLIGLDFNAGFTGALAGLAYLPRDFWTNDVCLKGSVGDAVSVDLDAEERDLEQEMSTDDFNELEDEDLATEDEIPNDSTDYDGTIDEDALLDDPNDQDYDPSNLPEPLVDDDGNPLGKTPVLGDSYDADFEGPVNDDDPDYLNAEFSDLG